MCLSSISFKLLMLSAIWLHLIYFRSKKEKDQIAVCKENKQYGSIIQQIKALNRFENGDMGLIFVPQETKNNTLHFKCTYVDGHDSRLPTFLIVLYSLTDKCPVLLVCC